MDSNAGRVELQRIGLDPLSFLASQHDPGGTGEPITLPDGSVVPRLPGYRKWIWDDDFAGVISVRWQPGTAALPLHVLGHIGYTVVPWKRRRGLATAALRELLPDIRDLGLPYVDLTTDVDNLASQKVISANGGVLVERFTKPTAYGPDSPCTPLEDRAHRARPLTVRWPTAARSRIRSRSGARGENQPQPPAVGQAIRGWRSS